MVRQLIYKNKRRKLIHNLQDIKRILSFSVTAEEAINDKEIMIAGLKRSGNHAFINWCENQQIGTFIHLNDVPLYENPYRYFLSVANSNDPKLKLAKKYILNQKFYKSNPDILEEEAKGNFSKKNCLIYSYEDRYLKRITSSFVLKTHDFYFGSTVQKYDVLILRDPFNMLASRLKSNLLPLKSVKNPIVELWIAYAKEYLGETQYLKNNKVVVNYNQWVRDLDYRKNIARQLKLDFLDKGLSHVPNFGGGSSFDKVDFSGKANEMKVFERWKYFIDDNLYRKLLDNKELLYYSEKIFGQIPGTECLIN